MNSADIRNVSLTVTQYKVLAQVHRGKNLVYRPVCTVPYQLLHENGDKIQGFSEQTVKRLEEQHLVRPEIVNSVYYEYKLTDLGSYYLSQTRP